MEQQTRLVYNAHSDSKNRGSLLLLCNIPTSQLFDNFMPPMPSVLLSASWSTSFCCFTHFQSASHFCPSPLCMGRVLLPPEQKQTPQTKKTPHSKSPNPRAPQTPSSALHSQDKAHTMELLLRLESNRVFCLMFCFLQWQFYYRKKNEYLYLQHLSRHLWGSEKG